MGEVLVRVKLVNAGDVFNMEQGRIKPEQVRSCEVDAIVDTGATRSTIPQHIVELLGLTVSGRGNATLADGRRVPIGVSSPVYFEIEGRETAEDAYILGDTVLVGQTVLEKTDLLVDCTNRKVIPRHPDGPVQYVRPLSSSSSFSSPARFFETEFDRVWCGWLPQGSSVLPDTQSE